MDNLLRIERIVTDNFEPDDIDSVLSFYSGFLKSKSSLIRQLNAVKDLYADHEVSQTLSNVILQMKDIVQKKLHVLFRDILMLLTIYMATPVTSVECERSFSALRRLKTWLRRTTSQQRLNHELILLLYAEEKIDFNSAVTDFVSLNDQRKADFVL